MQLNSLDAQREACESYIASQKHEGWIGVSDSYDDGGFTGGNMERPALKRLINDIKRKQIDTIVVYKVDRLYQALSDFAKLIDLFDEHNVSFVSMRSNLIQPHRWGV
jgi:DNA invertase Pin-like site-specific DNA recombinase